MSTMKQLRRILLVIFFLQPSVLWYFQKDQISEIPTDPVGQLFLYSACGISVLLSPFMALTVIRIQLRNFASDDVWGIPTADSNPLRLGNPLVFCHFGAQIALAVGWGCLLTSLCAVGRKEIPAGVHLTVIGITAILYGWGLFQGMIWAIRRAGDKIQPQSARPELFDL